MAFPCSLILDGQKIGKLWAGQTKTFEVDSGEHLLAARLLAGRVCEVVIAVDHGQEIHEMLDLPKWFNLGRQKGLLSGNNYLRWYKIQDKVLVPQFEHKKSRIFLWVSSKLKKTTLLAKKISDSKQFQAGLKVSEYAGKLAVVGAIINYIIEIPDRANQKHNQDWQLIDQAQGVFGDGGRKGALEDLVRDRIDISGIFMNGAVLRDIDLRGASMSGAAFRNANVTDAKFSCRSSILDVLDLEIFNSIQHFGDCWSPTNLNGAYFIDTKMWEADFTGADLTGAHFIWNKLSDADDDAISRNQELMNFSAANFGKDSVIQNVNFGGADFTAANFQDMKMENFNCSDCDFSYATFNHVQMSKVDLFDIHISVPGVPFLRGTKFSFVTLDGQPLSVRDIPASAESDCKQVSDMQIQC
jgi:uncharacterized protein YjbI with pentapeptide repeats